LIRSMTGFAEKKFDTKVLSVKISIRSLNHRFFDWCYRGSHIGEVENRLRAICQRMINRGRVEVHIDVKYLDPERWGIYINEPLLKQILSTAQTLSAKFDNKLYFSLENLFNLPQIIELKNKSFTEEEILFLENSFEKTMNILIKCREREGREIKKEIQSFIRNIQKAASRIEKLMDRQPSLIQERLVERLRELGLEAPFSEEKIVQEAACIAQRYDMSEEVVRLKFHLNYIKELLSLETSEPVGKKLDFIAQELYREANTINSKAQDIAIIKESLAIKSGIEGFRQQVQNLE